MILLKINPLNPNKEKIRIAAEAINKGNLVAFPTETVYGLGADATNSDAVLKIFKAKNRPLDNPIIVHISSIDQLEYVARDIPEVAYILAKKFWPGPLSIVLKRNEKIAKETSAGLDTVSVRLPMHPIALELINQSFKPIAAPSANKSGRPSPTTAKHVLEDFSEEIDVIIDGGRTIFGVESTVIDLTKENPVLLRPGALPINVIEKEIGKITIPDFAKGFKVDVENIAVTSPGIKYRHYAPQKPLILIEGDEEKIVSMMKKIIDEKSAQGKKVGIIGSEETINKIKIDNVIAEILGSRKNLFTIAYNLFSKLRKIDHEVDVIIAEGYPEYGIGLTVMNRLRKAASEIILA
jgi:Sua5/YciO/YrdC/YwlC family protein